MFDSISNQWELIAAICYIIYNEYKRYKTDFNTLYADKLELVKLNSASLQYSKDIKFNKSIKEINVFIINKFKHYKLKILKELTIETELVELAADDILLNILLKIEKVLMNHIENNGYHDLNLAEYDNYIHYIANEVYDIFLLKLEKTNNMIKISDIIKYEEIEEIIREIINTAKDITFRKN